LLNNDFGSKENGWFKSQYLNILEEMGIANYNGTINNKELLTAFTAYYGENFLKLMQSHVDIYSDSNWLLDIVRRKNKTSHPLRHILMARFLGITLDDLFNKKINYKPFNKGPYPCLNITCSNYLKPVIDKVDVRYSNDAKRPIGVFQCSCGFMYTRTGPDKTETDIYKIGKMKEYGQVWEEKLKELIESDLSLREMARRL